MRSNSVRFRPSHPRSLNSSTSEIRTDLMKLQLAIIASLSFLMVGCGHFGHGCYNPSTGLVHSGPCGLFDNCGTGLCKQKTCRCRSGRKQRCQQNCHACESQGQFGEIYPSGPMTYGDGGMIYEGTGSAHCPTCEGQQSTNYPELMVPQDVPSNRILPAPAAESAPDSQTYTVPYPSNGMTIPPVNYSTPSSYLPPQMSSVPPIETAAF